MILDLKKLIKNCNKQKKEDVLFHGTPIIKENVYKNLPTKSNWDSLKFPTSQKNSDRNQDFVNEDKPTKKVQQISLHLLKNRPKICHEHCVHVQETCDTDNKSTSKESKPEVSESTSKTTIPSKDSKSTSSSSQRQRGGACRSLFNIQQFPIKSDNFLAKPTKSINRRDPVALYQYYQSEWKKVKFPGEEEHAMLRRMVRKKLQGEQMSKRF